MTNKRAAAGARCIACFASIVLYLFQMLQYSNVGTACLAQREQHPSHPALRPHALVRVDDSTVAYAN